ncbi:hypothetical protein RBSH_04768 [Rhodopirellula baltica SH28]|uniref:Uncharacterized protein n=1 Tax=Rhodopirellula baltica SH28 TaxID=993517 RepID=K5C9A3_RHOBT|nr:hypothetical protein RBSH_04768 [Rhodopirellula baltica SH28]
MRKSPINRLASRLFSDACQETIPLNGRACPEEKKFPGKDGTDRSGFSHEALAFVLSPQSTRLSRCHTQAVTDSIHSLAPAN